MKRVLLSVIWILTATVICSAQTSFYFPDDIIHYQSRSCGDCERGSNN